MDDPIALEANVAVVAVAQGKTAHAGHQQPVAPLVLLAHPIAVEADQQQVFEDARAAAGELRVQERYLPLLSEHPPNIMLGERTMQLDPPAIDREFFDRELQTFVPDRIFDAHCHLWHAKRASEPGLPERCGYSVYRQSIDVLHPGRDVAGIFIPIPDIRPQMAAANEWIAREIRHDPRCRGEFFVKPEDDPEWVRQEVRRLGLHGLKCYHTMSAHVPTWEADIPSYLPEPIVKVADEEGWFITLHLVKARAVADPGNIHWIRHYCTRYPNMRLILAHSARGFQPAHNLEGLPQLNGLENCYFDSSANCEPMAHVAILKILGHRNFLYGSDFFISHFRGRPVAAADSFLWIDERSPVWGEKHMRVKPVLVGLEHLRSLKWACWTLGLSDAQVEDIFWNNAAKLFGVSR